MRYRHRIIATMLVCVCLAGCRTKVEAPKDEATQESWGPAPTFADAPTRVAVKANNQFACEILKQLAKEQPNSNQFICPWSISIALAMALEGAQGDTALEMGKVLGLPDDLRQDGSRPWKLEDYHAGFASLMRRYAAAQNTDKDQLVREKIAKLRMELETLNTKIRGERGDYRTTMDLHKKAVNLAATINELQLQIDPFELRLANAVWGEKSYSFSKDYEKAISRYYGISAIRSADFIHQFPSERSKINRWVEIQTKDKIRDLIPDLKSEEAKLVRMILVNAIYFKSQWSDPFRKDQTTNQLFLDAAAGTTAVPLMARHGNTGYAAFNGDGSYFPTPDSISMDKSDRAQSQNEKVYPDDDGIQVAELRYKSDKLGMTIILPRQVKGLPALESKLTARNLENWLAKLWTRPVNLWLPRFKMEKNYALTEPLQSMGIKKAFSSDADFHGIAKPANPKDELHISQILHKSIIEVNEEGTEAAAAAADIFVAKSAEKSQPFTPVFRANHPFLFVIRDIESGAILFVGRMAKAEPQ
jgi:serine protease inhibitor